MIKDGRTYQPLSDQNKPNPTTPNESDLDKILGDLLEATYHFDGKTSVLISPKALAKIKAQILANYIPKADVVKAIGEDEVLNKVRYGGYELEPEHEGTARNQLRQQIRKGLGL